tara:strand:- start:4126 stop:4917 length:792 start_codon:yes stop_codon:yes gene_type:complete
MSILKEIYKYKLAYVSEQKKDISKKKIQDKIKINSLKKFSFYKKLKSENKRISIIGELKRASPSLGNFVKQNINLVEIAKIYEENQISCLSVLTDEKYFKGSIDDLVNIRNNSLIPILRKDFIVDEYQIYESKLCGADCILIILSMLNQTDAERFTEIANELEIDTIIEVHNIEEFERAQLINSKIIGINNRNLNNFKTDLKTTIQLSKKIFNDDKLLISESGFHSKEDIDKIFNQTGINNFLIGEYLMKSENLAVHIKELLR